MPVLVVVVMMLMVMMLGAGYGVLFSTWCPDCQQSAGLERTQAGGARSVAGRRLFARYQLFSGCTFSSPCCAKKDAQRALFFRDRLDARGDLVGCQLADDFERFAGRHGLLHV
jgi:hypothetical protein